MTAIEIFKQRGVTLLPDNKTYELRFEVKSESTDSLYTIARNKANKQWACSCRGWIRHRTCKHLQAVQSVIGAYEREESKQIQ